MAPSQVSDDSQDVVYGSKMNLSFSGCGFLGFYHVGVASCIREYAPQLVQTKIAGTSAGSLAACALITGACLGECTTYVIRIATQARARALGPLHPTFNMVKYLRDGLEEFLPDDAHLTASGRLHVSLTRVCDRQNVIVTQFDSKEDLIQVLICSCFVPFYCGIFPPKYKGVRYIDGGLSDNLPILDEHTITVSPLAGESDISPRDDSASFLHITLGKMSIQFTEKNLGRLAMALFPPCPETLMKLTRYGFDDALKFLQRNSLITCSRHYMRIESSITTDGPAMALPSNPVSTVIDDGLEEDDASDVSGSASNDHASCEDCKRRESVAQLDSLPPSVVTAIQSAADSANKGALSPVYNLRAFKVISLLSAPLILPLDVAIMLLQSSYDWGPYLPGDMLNLAGELCDLIKELLSYLQTKRQKYSARLSCQLGLMKVYATSKKAVKDVQPSKHGHRMRHKSSDAAHVIADPELGEGNVAFHVDFKSHHHTPRRCVDDLRHHLLDGDYKLEDIRSLSNSASNLVDLEEVESRLQQANHMDSSLAFFYMDEKDNRTVRVSELYVYDDVEEEEDKDDDDDDNEDEDAPSTSAVHDSDLDPSDHSDHGDLNDHDDDQNDCDEMNWDSSAEQFHSEPEDPASSNSELQDTSAMDMDVACDKQLLSSRSSSISILVDAL